MDYGSSGLFLRQSQVGLTSADLQVTVEARNDSTISQSVLLNTFIVDARNVIVQTLSSTEIIAAHAGHTFVQTMIIGQPHLWDGQRDPYLYHVYAQVQVDSSFKDLVSSKGLCTYDRKTCKDAYYWYKANWTTAPFVYIAERRFSIRTVATTDIKVYANTDTVTLKINGVSLGTKTSTNHIFQWSSVPLQVGNNTVEAVSTQGNETYADIVTWDLQ